MWELDYKESWTTKNWCFWTVVLERALESPLDCKQTNQSILKEISPEYSLEGLMLKLKLKLQYFGHLMRTADSLKVWCWERLKAGGQGDDRGQDGWMASLTQWTWVWTRSGRWWRTGKPGVLQSMGCKELNMTERLNNSKHLNISPALVFHNSTTQFLYFQLFTALIKLVFLRRAKNLLYPITLIV